MTIYKAPIRDILFSTQYLGALDEIARLSSNQDLNSELLNSILQEAAKMGEQVLAPLNRIGDIEGARYQEGRVTTVAGWKEAYTQFIENGWNGLSASDEYGGQGLPYLVTTAVQEIWHGANMAFSLCTLLTQGAIESIQLHGSKQQKETYLPNLISGVWSGTMNLTEPQAGSDLAAIKTTATPQQQHYRLKGQKIFITYGDHDLSDNIIHLVLARTPNSPPGIRGISLFIVPKLLPDANDQWCIRNDIETLSIEHKLGVRGSPTAALSYGSKEGAIGYLVGEENQGMKYMFTMMNFARLAVGVEANGVAEAAYQQAVWFANQRQQGTAIDDNRGQQVPIIKHADIKRMLMLQKCRIESVRSLSLVLANALDTVEITTDANRRSLSQAIVDILTPVVKGYGTELSLENVSLALQVHGGMGFIEETGAAQHYRDQRITTIYEGTTGIQALDLIGRKLLRDQGVISNQVISFIEADIQSMAHGDFVHHATQLADGIDKLRQTIVTILAMQDPRQPTAIAEPYLRLWGTLLCGWQMFKAAIIADSLLTDNADIFFETKIATAHFYFDYEMPKINHYSDIIQSSNAQQITLMSEQTFVTMQ